VALVTWFGWYQVAQSSTAQAQNLAASGSGDETRYTAAIFIPSEAGGCRQVMFDNNSGNFREQGQTPCLYRTPPPPDPAEARTNAIRNAFTKR
jgi:hypothetical protein